MIYTHHNKLIAELEAKITTITRQKAEMSQRWSNDIAELSAQTYRLAIELGKQNLAHRKKSEKIKRLKSKLSEANAEIARLKLVKELDT